MHCCLPPPSPPTWSCDCERDSWHHAYKIRALCCRGKQSQALFPLVFFSSIFSVLLLDCQFYSFFSVGHVSVSFPMSSCLSFLFLCLNALLVSYALFWIILNFSGPLGVSNPVFQVSDAALSPAQVTFTVLSVVSVLTSTCLWSDCWCAERLHNILPFVFNPHADTQFEA